MNHDVFISYSSKNPAAAQAICHELEDNGIKCWMAPRNITPGKKYGDLIDDAILTCRVFLLVYSADSLSSQWCNGELNVAFTEGKTIIPYRIDATPLKGAMRVILNQTHWIDAYPNYKTRFKDLVTVVGQSLGKNIPSTIGEVYPPVPIPQPTPNRFKKYWWVALCALILGAAVWCILPEKSEVSTNISAETEIISEQATQDLIAQESTDSNAELEELRAEKARIEQENEALKQNNAELQHSNAELQNNNSDLQKNINDFKTKEAQQAKKVKETQTAKSSTTIQTEPKSSTFTQKTTTTSTSKVEHKSVQTATAQKTEEKETKKDNAYLLNLPDSEFERFEDGDKYGFKLKSTDEIVIPLKYDNVGPFSEGFAWVVLNGKYGLVDKTGKEITPLKYDRAIRFSEGGLAGVKSNGKYGYVDKTGKEVIPLKYDDGMLFCEGLVAVKLNDKYGFVDRNGKEVIPLKYDYTVAFREGLAAVQLNGKAGHINKKGEFVTPLKYYWTGPFYEGLAAVALNDRFGFVDKTGEEIIPLKYDEASSFDDGKAKVKLNGDEFYIDKNGNRIE